MKKHLQKTFCALIFICASQLNAQTAFPEYFFGESAWMPDSIGTCSSSKCVKNGKLDSNWTNIYQSNVKIMRAGGIAPDDTSMSDYQYIKRIDSMRSRGIEPIMQVPFDNGGYDSIKAHDIVTYVNITKNKGVKYWSIGNEPTSYPANKYAAQIADYIKKFSIAMKKVDSTIRIIGPDLNYIGDPWSSDPAFKLADSLTKPYDSSYSIMGTIPGGNGKASGKGYIDYFSYHIYNYKGDTNATRSWLINRLTAAGKDSARMGWLKRRLDSCNTAFGRTASQPLLPVITEAHICYYQLYNPSNDTWAGTKSSSFFAGQHWTEMSALAAYKGIRWINFWSIMEGSGLGYMTNATNPIKKSTYHHFKEMSKWFSDSLYLGSDDSAGTAITNIKALGSKNGNHIAIMILNQDSTNRPDRVYKLRLDNSYSGSGDTTRIKMNMGTFSTVYTDTIKAASTTLLIFDCQGSVAYKYRYDQDSTYTPFQSVWASGRPVTLLSVSISPDIAKVKANCDTTYTATPTGCSGNKTYTWKVNGSTISSGSSNTFIWSGSGDAVVSVELTCSSNGCNPAKARAIYDVIPGIPCDPEGPGKQEVSIENSSINNESSAILSIVPNPANNQTTVYYRLSDKTGKEEIRITDIFGKIIRTVPVFQNDSNTIVDCSDFATGIYFYSLVINGETIQTEKVSILK